MEEKLYTTPLGNISYRTDFTANSEITLIFLPGLTADRTLFDKQTEYFAGRYNILVWDAPGHGKSRPFTFDFDLKDKAKWLYGILQAENIQKPVFVGQSMGGYVSQMFMQLYPGVAAGFVSIDSAPLKRKYTTRWEIYLLGRCEWMYRIIPRQLLISWGAWGCNETKYGRGLMKNMMLSYTKDQYCTLAGHGMGMLSKALARDLDYNIDCPAILIYGEKDKAGSAKSYNKRWAKGEKLTVYPIADAGHNSNTDKPEEVNKIIENFININF